MKLLKILIFLLIFSNFVLLGYVSSTGKVILNENAVLIRVIDGDTIETNLGKVRLLGINTPEKKEPYYQEANDFLMQYEGKEIELERTIENKDKYGRLLRYVFYDGKFINEEILKQGLANFYSYNEDKYTSKLKKAEEIARNEGKGLWKKSQSYGCVEIIKFQYIEKERCKNQERIILKNNCDKLSLIMKDDANHIYDIEINDIYEENFSCVWNDEGDTLTLRDESGLVLFYRYT